MTVSAYVAVKAPSAVFAVIVVFPGASAVTTPLTTLATAGAELDHVTALLLASAGCTVAVSVVCPPTVSSPKKLPPLSSDAMVTVEPGEGIDFTLDSSVINQYGNQIRKVTMETLKNLGVDNVSIHIVDKGALDCTLKARIEGAVYRAVEQYENLPWGGAIQ